MHEKNATIVLDDIYSGAHTPLRGVNVVPTLNIEDLLNCVTNH